MECTGYVRPDQKSRWHWAIRGVIAGSIVGAASGAVLGYVATGMISLTVLIAFVMAAWMGSHGLYAGRAFSEIQSTSPQAEHALEDAAHRLTTPRQASAAIPTIPTAIVCSPYRHRWHPAVRISTRRASQ